MFALQDSFTSNTEAFTSQVPSCGQIKTLPVHNKVYLLEESQSAVTAQKESFYADFIGFWSWLGKH